MAAKIKIYIVEYKVGKQKHTAEISAKHPFAAAKIIMEANPDAEILSVEAKK